MYLHYTIIIMDFDLMMTSIQLLFSAKALSYIFMIKTLNVRLVLNLLNIKQYYILYIEVILSISMFNNTGGSGGI